MREFAITQFAKVRVATTRVLPPIEATDRLVEIRPVAQQSDVWRTHLTLEAYVPRGASTQYGLLGVTFEHSSDAELVLEVPFADGDGTEWAGSLASSTDSAFVGLPREYAAAVMAGLIDGSAQRFPPGTLRLVEAAHSMVGSSNEFFTRLAAATVVLMSEKRDAEGMKSYLAKVLV